MTDEPHAPHSLTVAPPAPHAQANAPTLPRFPLGQLVATPGALQTLREFGITPLSLIKRHIGGDWGGLCSADKQVNEQALAHGSRIMSVYLLSREDETGLHESKLWVITGADRSSTCVLLPSEY